jgi:hypothetical protein
MLQAAMLLNMLALEVALPPAPLGFFKDMISKKS